MSQRIWVKNDGQWKQVQSNVSELWSTLSTQEIALISGNNEPGYFRDRKKSQQVDGSCSQHERTKLSQTESESDYSMNQGSHSGIPQMFLL